MLNDDISNSYIPCVSPYFPSFLMTDYATKKTNDFTCFSYYCLCNCCHRVVCCSMVIYPLTLTPTSKKDYQSLIITEWCEPSKANCINLLVGCILFDNLKATCPIVLRKLISTTGCKA